MPQVAPVMRFWNHRPACTRQGHRTGRGRGREIVLHVGTAKRLFLLLTCSYRSLGHCLVRRPRLPAFVHAVERGGNAGLLGCELQTWPHPVLTFDRGTELPSAGLTLMLFRNCCAQSPGLQNSMQSKRRECLHASNS